MQYEHALHTISPASVKQTQGNYCISDLYRWLNKASPVGHGVALTFGVGHAESNNWKRMNMNNICSVSTCVLSFNVTEIIQMVLDIHVTLCKQ